MEGRKKCMCLERFFREVSHTRLSAEKRQNNNK